MNIPERYERNCNTISACESGLLLTKNVLVVGCGGLGGYMIEMLARLGVGNITVSDGDVFEVSNLNRQILSDETVIGKPKAEVARERISRVNSGVQINAYTQKITAQNSAELLKNCDVVVDAVDNIETRFILQNEAEKAKIPLVHGAIAGWYAQVTTILPGDRTLDLIYPERKGRGIESDLGNPAFIPALAASLQVQEVLKLLIGRGRLLQKKLLFIDLLEHEYRILSV